MSATAEGRPYDLKRWKKVRERVLARDGRCVIGTLVGGNCKGRRHVHHLHPVSEGGAPFDESNLIVVCNGHHSWIESARRVILEKRGWRSCTHEHRSAEARRACERRLNRR